MRQATPAGRWDACSGGTLPEHTGPVTSECSLAAFSLEKPPPGRLLTPTEAEHTAMAATPQQSRADQAPTGQPPSLRKAAGGGEGTPRRCLARTVERARHPAATAKAAEGTWGGLGGAGGCVEAGGREEAPGKTPPGRRARVSGREAHTGAGTDPASSFKCAQPLQVSVIESH